MKAVDAIALGTCYVDINLANYPFGEAGIPTETELVGDTYETVAGGSAVNFCRLLTTCGLQTAFIGMAGQDQHGTLLEQLLHESAIESLLIRQPDLLTNISFNMTSPTGEHIMLVAGTANKALAPELVLPRLQESLATARMLYMGSCFKLLTLASAYTAITQAAQQSNTMLVVDHGRIPVGTSDDLLEVVRQLALKAAYYLPSHAEFCQLWNVASIEEGLQLLHTKAPDVHVIVKDGARGAFYWEEGSVRHVPTPKVDKVVHATGAGDSFNAGVMTAIARGRSIAEATAYGCRVGAAKVAGQPIPTLPLATIA